MTGNFEISLSSNEFCVLAAFMGYEYVFGIDENAVCNPGSEIRDMVKFTVRALEKRKLLRWALNRCVFIDVNIQNVIKTVCEADFVGVFSGSHYRGTKNYVFKKNGEKSFVVIKYSKSGKLNVSACDCFNGSELLPALAKKSGANIHERVLLEEAETVKQYLVSFRQYEAEEALGKILKDASASAAFEKILTGSCPCTCVKLYKKSKTVFSEKHSGVIVKSDSGYIKITVDENGVLFFDTEDIKNIRDDFDKIFDEAVK